MKMLFLSLALITASRTTFANTSHQIIKSLQELCLLEPQERQEEQDNFENKFVEVRSLDIKTVDALTDSELKMVNAHLLSEKYVEKVLTFAEAKALFSDGGEQAYNDLYVITFKSNASGRTYVQVKSYPGDNPYGLIFDAKTGKAVAHNSDDSITLLTDNGPYSCWILQKQK